MINRVLGDFRLRQQIGVGGGGTVYLAEQLTLARDAVVKVIIRRKDDAGVERFLREARLASQLDHPFAAHIYDFGHEPDGVLWLAMELVRGMPLDRILKEQGPVPLGRFVPFFERLGEVLQAAHDQGIVHRDIKPANVMVLNRAGRLLPKLLDLGISRRLQGHSKAVTLGGDETLDGLREAPRLGSTDLESTWGDRISESETLELTQAGVVIGSPQYMAPEQWVDAASADARSDLYSLAILAYQALTGLPPFTAKTLGSLFKSHAREPLPTLPDGLPTSLWAVLARGAAKASHDRYESVTQFTAAFRAASGLEVEPFSLPQLSDEVRDNVRAQAPQPIAEAVALLESARTPRQQLEALEAVRRVLVRYVAVMALGARQRIGPGRSTDTPEVIELCQRLARGRLNDGEWLSLAVELCRPFSHQTAAHPLPELVAFLSSTGPETQGEGFQFLQALTRSTPVDRETSDVEVHETLVRLVPRLNLLLMGLHFIFDYSLTVMGTHPERWMGARRSKRLPQRGVQAKEQSYPQGAVVLVDQEGVPVATLSPLLQMMSPGAGLPDELFFVDGEGRHATRMLAIPGPFERQSDEVWPWFKRTIDEFTADETSQARERPPFKGLATFTAEDSDNYFGREKEAESFANRLRVARLLAVVGPSGSGKSSFVLAGVLPLLRSGWRSVVVRPGATPFENLRSRVSSALGLDAFTGGLDAKAILAALAPEESLLLVIDQFEELVTLCPDPEARDRFASWLVTLADDESARLRVVVTLRDDFLIRVQQLPALRERLSGALQLLSTPAPDDLLRVLIEPTKRVGYSFDDPALPARMVKQVSEYPGALALLSFTASQLWELRDRHLRQLRSQTYEALGGVGGALAHHAEVTLGAMSEEEGKTVREAFRHLVTSSLTRAVMSRQELTEVLGGAAVAGPVIDQLISARLLVSSEETDNDDHIEVIHEALIVSWPRLVSWLREDAETARLRDSLRASARQWGERGRPSGLLWRKETLAEYRVWRARFGGRLTQLEQAFADASLRDETRAALARRATISLILLGLVIGLVVLYRSSEASKASAVLAEQRALESRQRLERLWQEQGRLAMVDGKPMEAIVYSRAAQRLGARSPAIDQVIAVAADSLRGYLGTVAEVDGRINAFAVTDDQGWLLSSANETALHSLRAPAQQRRWKQRCRGVAFSSDSKRALMACDDLTAISVDLSSMEETRAKLPTVFSRLVRNRDGLFVGTESGDTVHLLTIEGQVQKVLYRVPGAPSLDAVPAPDGTTYIFPGGSMPTPLSPRSLLALSASGELEWQSEASDDLIKRVVVDPVTAQVAVSRSNGMVLVYDKRHRLLWQQQVGQAEAKDLAFVEGLLIIPQENGLLAALDAETGAPRYLAVAAATEINRVVSSGDGKSLFLAASDGSVRKVDTVTGSVTFAHHGHDGRVTVLAVIGDQVLSGGQDGTIRKWDARIPFAQRLTDEPITLLRATREGFFAVTASSLIHVAADGGVSRRPRPPSDPHSALYAAWEAPGSKHHYFFKSDGLEVFEGDTLRWSAPGVMTFVAIDPETGRVVYGTDGSKVHLVNVVTDGGAPTEIAAFDSNNDMMLLGRFVLTNNGRDLLSVDLSDPQLTVKTAPAHRGVFNFSLTGRPDFFLTYGIRGNGQLLGWSASDLSRPAFRIDQVPSDVLAADLSDDGSTVSAVLGDGSLSFFDTQHEVMLSKSSLAQLADAAAINLALGSVAFQDAKGRLMRASLPRVPAFADDATLDAFMRARVPLELDGEKLVRRGH